MINDLVTYLKDKKILILGFGREGKSTYNLIRKYLKEQEIYISDQKEDFWKEYDYLKEDKYARFISGEGYLEGLQDYDIIMKSPGISFAKMDTSKYINKIKSQLELLLEFFKNITTIGVTGTKGKSTTTSLIYTMLKEQGKKALLLGNIGTPVFDYIDTLEDEITLVLEMSSHQLEYMKVSPKISIILNIFPEHLDHYQSFKEYAEAKCNIFKYQGKKDIFLYNADNKTLKELVNNVPENTYKVSMSDESSNVYLKNDKVYFNGKVIYDKNEPRNLKGDYNLSNIMFVLALSEIMGLELNKTIQSIKEFKTLAHRLEFVGKYNDILYYDNSIGTIPEATIEAVNALKEVDTLIIGGMDRGIDYNKFIQYLNNSDIGNIICMPKTGHEIAKGLKREKAHIVETLEEAVETAKKVTKKGKICLLSPAAASYGYFKNFEEKGDMYKELIKRMCAS